ncbi:hypothetical protein AAC387_Pa05g2067 [Persea americana]
MFSIFACISCKFEDVKMQVDHKPVCSVSSPQQMTGEHLARLLGVSRIRSGCGSLTEAEKQKSSYFRVASISLYMAKTISIGDRLNGKKRFSTFVPTRDATLLIVCS